MRSRKIIDSGTFNRCKEPSSSLGTARIFVPIAAAVSLSACVSSTTPSFDVGSLGLSESEFATSSTTDLATAVTPAEGPQTIAQATSSDMVVAPSLETETAALAVEATSVEIASAASPGPVVPVPQMQDESVHQIAAASLGETPKVTTTAAAPDQINTQTAASVSAEAPVAAAIQAARPAKQSAFARFFGSRRSKPSASGTAGVRTASAFASVDKPVAGATAQERSSGDAGSGDALPGVRKTLFGIGSKNGDDNNALLVASASGLGRGLARQTERVSVSCLKPDLVRRLKYIESHYRRPVIVTSGFRSGNDNRRAGGARGSKHMSCEAADIQVPGVSKWDLATFVRAMPGRGGVGTYCHTESVHVDIGKERDWNWRCRRRKK